MAELEQQASGTAFAGVTVEGNDFASLLNKEFKPKSDEAKSAVEAAELDQFCRTSGLANFKRPRRFVFVDAIPKSPVGKLLRRMLTSGDYAVELHPPSSPS